MPPINSKSDFFKKPTAEWKAKGGGGQGVWATGKRQKKVGGG